VNEEQVKALELSEEPEAREAAQEVAQEVEPEVVRAAVSAALMRSWVVW
jgi:hypothetical protein